MKIGECVEQVAADFDAGGLAFGHGADNAWDEACFLVLHCCELPPDADASVAEQALTEDQLERIQSIAKQRIETQKPLAYLLNTAWFAGHKFYVDERVLVPRSPFAELISSQFEPWVDPDSVQSVLDLCTGGGCIGIATALAMPWANVTASDISHDALAVAKKNVQRHHVADRVTLCQSDLFKELQGQQFDLIISNPPYVDQQDIDDMPNEFHHEPMLGLASGVDGLVHTRQILAQAAAHLTDQGVLIVEVGNSAEALMQAYPQLPFVWIGFANGGDGVFMLKKADLV